MVEQGMSQVAESDVSTKELAPYISATIPHGTKQLLPPIKSSRLGETSALAIS